MAGILFLFFISAVTDRYHHYLTDGKLKIGLNDDAILLRLQYRKTIRNSALPSKAYIPFG